MKTSLFIGDFPITAEFGEHNPELWSEPLGHKGVDFGMPSGTSIIAPFSAIWRPQQSDDFGLYYSARDAEKNTHFLCHLSSQSDHDMFYDKGSFLGLSGSSGKATASHVHYQANDPQGNPIDPMPFIMKQLGYIYNDSGVIIGGPSLMPRTPQIQNIIDVLNGWGIFLAQIELKIVEPNGVWSETYKISTLSQASKEILEAKRQLEEEIFPQ